MKIEGLSYRLGSKIVTNQDLIKQIQDESKIINPEILNKICKQIGFYFTYSGCVERRWLEEGETAIGITKKAILEAVEEANCSLDEIDLLIHVGLGRGFLEAGQSYFIAQTMSMKTVHCFDIMDACNSWSRGMFVAYNFLRQKVYKRILIVNTECNMIPGGIVNPRLFRFSKFEDIDASFAGLTLADGATATILTDSDQEWKFGFESRPESADLCAVPLDVYDSFAEPSELLAYNGKNKFTSFAKQMNEAGRPIVLQMMSEILGDFSKYKLIFPHGHSYNTWIKNLYPLGINEEKIKWNTFKKYGNLASACIPISIKMAIENGELIKRDRFATVVASGGLSFSVIDGVI